MKKYSICFYLFAVSLVICVITGYIMTRKHHIDLEKESQGIACTEPPTQSAPQTVAADSAIASASNLFGNYCLVVEDRFLLVFCAEKRDICLYTHIPITDFPKSEQERLREGIWFEDMAAVYSYLESFTS